MSPALMLACATFAAAPALDFEARIEGARTQFGEGEYERALTEAQAARAVARSRDEQRIALMWEGVVLTYLRRATLAADSFRAALELDPDAVLPVATSSKVAAEVEAIRAQVKAARPAAPTAVVQPAPAAPVQRKPMSLLLPVTFGVASAATFGVGGYFGAVSRGDVTDARREPVQTRVGLLHQRATDEALVANVCFAAASAVAVAALVILLFEVKGSP